MKLKITITGPKVHDVGYRYLLLGGAMGLHLPGFYAANLVELEKQIVEVLVEGKEPQVKAFIEFVQNNKPANARVSDIATSEYEDDVPRRSEYTQDITALQMLKAIPTILKIEAPCYFLWVDQEVPEKSVGFRVEFWRTFTTEKPT
ncbi:MAG TPA: acylphosphatase [Methanotrichaceae archaeon]|nr:acylphosphatase [Methanotrichaceae archaeon]